MKQKPEEKTKPKAKPQKEKMVRLSLRIPVETYNKLKAISTKFKISMTAIVRSILTSAILTAMKVYPQLLKKGETVEQWEKKWEHDIIPGFDFRRKKKFLTDCLKALGKKA